MTRTASLILLFKHLFCLAAFSQTYTLLKETYTSNVKLTRVNDQPKAHDTVYYANGTIKESTHFDEKSQMLINVKYGTNGKPRSYIAKNRGIVVNKGAILEINRYYYANGKLKTEIIETTSTITTKKYNAHGKLINTSKINSPQPPAY
jgi:antitoxin component YwqK of YwqJK toxin-antitoxin module